MQASAVFCANQNEMNLSQESSAVLICFNYVKWRNHNKPRDIQGKRSDYIRILAQALMISICYQNFNMHQWQRDGTG